MIVGLVCVVVVLGCLYVVVWHARGLPPPLEVGVFSFLLNVRLALACCLALPLKIYLENKHRNKQPMGPLVFQRCILSLMCKIHTLQILTMRAPKLAPLKDFFKLNLMFMVENDQLGAKL